MPVNEYECSNCRETHDRMGVVEADYCRCPNCDAEYWHHRVPRA